MQKIILIGVGNTALDIFYFINDYKLFEVVGFAVDQKYKKIDFYKELPVYCIEELDSYYKKDEISLFIPIQWNYLNKQRKDLYYRLKNKGFNFVSIISPNAVIHSCVTIGDNCWIADYVIIESNVTIGNNVFIKSRATVGHFSVIYDHAFIGISSIIGGKSIVGEQSFIGINSTIFDEVKIGKKCLIGACSIVKRSLSDYTIIKTTQAHLVQSQSDEHTIEGKLVASKSIR